MPVTDTIADMLTRIRNAIMVRHDSVVVPYSAIKVSLLKLMEREGFIKGFVKTSRDNRDVLVVTLRYYEDKESVIHGLERISKPGLRIYVGKDEIPLYYGGLGVSFLSTPKGIMTGVQAKRNNVGGELLFYVW